MWFILCVDSTIEEFYLCAMMISLVSESFHFYSEIVNPFRSPFGKYYHLAINKLNVMVDHCAGTKSDETGTRFELSRSDVVGGQARPERLLNKTGLNQSNDQWSDSAGGHGSQASPTSPQFIDFLGVGAR